MIRSAASRPDSSAVGTPTPGTVDDPASTTLSIPRTVLAGRNGPVWPKRVRQRERGAGRHALTRPAGRIDDVQQLGVAAERGNRSRDGLRASARCRLAAGRAPIDFAHSGIRRRRQDVEQVATRQEPAAGHRRSAG